MASTTITSLPGRCNHGGPKACFSHRDTDLEPSKSGVIGLLCAAMGIPRGRYAKTGRTCPT